MITNRGEVNLLFSDVRVRGKVPESMKYLEGCSQKDYTFASMIFTFGPVYAYKDKNEKALNSLVQKYSFLHTSKKILKLALVTLGIAISFYFIPTKLAIATTVLLLSSLSKITIHTKKYRATYFKTPFSPIKRLKAISAYLFGTTPPLLINHRFVIKKANFGINL